TADSCDPATGNCINTPDVDCDDSNACTADSCDPATGNCINTPDVDCDDSNACTADSCDPATGDCINTPDVDCDDNNACTADSCDPATGDCINTPDVDCDDNNECTDDSCDPDTGLCVNEDNGTCGEAICRTPGFWGARGGDEKNGENITEYFIGDGFVVCGVPITNTNLNDPNSAIEAICINKSDVGDRKIIRDLTSAMLNCNTSNCPDEIVNRIAECNQLCDDGQDYGTCAAELDCYNNGNTWDYDEGMCIENFGECSISDAYCSDDMPCEGGEGDYCIPNETCHDRELCPEDGDYCFEPPGPASSSGKCNKARKNSLYIGE
ncbi:MAG: hypothetical protein OES90_12320, partial [Xanthomonadales bacterium]|nr:hypothetical protein [Xanthomonadales bacterium]